MLGARQGSEKPRLRFARSGRLINGRQFQQVFARPTRAADACLTVLARDNGGGDPRLGLAIARRRVRRAVDRNRIKRVARESFRHHRHLLQGLDLVVMARDHAGQRSSTELHASLAAHWQRLNERCNHSSSASFAVTATS